MRATQLLLETGDFCRKSCLAESAFGRAQNFLIYDNRQKYLLFANAGSVCGRDSRM